MAEKNVNQQELFDIARKNEPAQSANCTSPTNNNSSNYDDNMICRNCQAQLLKKLELIEQVLNLYIFEDDEVNIPMLSAIIGEAHGMFIESGTITLDEQRNITYKLTGRCMLSLLDRRVLSRKRETFGELTTEQLLQSYE